MNVVKTKKKQMKRLWKKEKESVSQRKPLLRFLVCPSEFFYVYKNICVLSKKNHTYMCAF